MGETEHAAGHGLRVLVVDDTEHITDMLGTLLMRAGYEAVLTYSAHEALVAALARPCDVIISDIGMPGTDGYALAAQLRAIPEYRDVPMLALTGFGEYDDRARALAAGFDEYLRKPIDAELLLATLKRLQKR